MINAEQYSLPDFNTAEPYKAVYSIQNSFDREIAYNAMKDRANYLGFKGFGKTYKAYEKSQNKAQNIPIGNTTAFDGQKVELLCGDYVCDDTGVYMPCNGFMQTICMHPVMPVERLVNIDTGEEKLKIAYRSTKAWRETVASKETLGSASQIVKLWSKGISVTSKTAKDLAEYIAFMEIKNIDKLATTSSVGRLGWIGTGDEKKFAPYVDGIVFDGEDYCKRLFESVRQQGSYERWVETVNEVRKKCKTARIVLAGAFASVLLKDFNLHPFFIHIYGGAGLGKTLLLCLAASVYASPIKGDYITTFNSTVFGQEMTATFLNSLPMCIDELQIQSSAGVNDFDKIIYTLAEGIGKTRGTKEGGIKSQTSWANCFISTGERPITNYSSGGGAVLRAIEIELDERVSEDGSKLAETLKNNFGFAGKKFVEALSDPVNQEKITQAQKRYFKELQKLDIADKQSYSASALLAADELAQELIFKDGLPLTINDIRPYLVTNKDMDVNAKAIDYLMNVVAQHPNQFKSVGGEYKGEAWGVDTGDEIRIIKTVFDRILQEQGYNSTVVLSYAKKKGILVTDGNRNTKKCSFGGRKLNCVVIKQIDEDENDTDMFQTNEQTINKPWE